jgi:drug/metabolite transporter (DMT)-like permease
MKLADASAILPLDFVRLPLTALIAYLAFGEHVDLWTWTGAVIIAVSATYIARREVTAAQQVATKQ